MERQYFSKSWLPSLPLVLPLSPLSHFLSLSPRQAVPLAAVSTMQIPELRGRLECICMCMRPCNGVRGGSLIQEPPTCKSALKHANLFFFFFFFVLWDHGMLKLSTISTQHQCQMPETPRFLGAWPFVGAPSVQWLAPWLCFSRCKLSQWAAFTPPVTPSICGPHWHHSGGWLENPPDYPAQPTCRCGAILLYFIYYVLCVLKTLLEAKITIWF